MVEELESRWRSEPAAASALVLQEDGGSPVLGHRLAGCLTPPAAREEGETETPEQLQTPRRTYTQEPIDSSAGCAGDGVED